MNKSDNLYIRINPETKAEAENLFASFGITVSDAVNMFLHKSIMIGGLPFDVVQPKYNLETENAIAEVKDIISGKVKANAKSVTDFINEMGE